MKKIIIFLLLVLQTCIFGQGKVEKISDSEKFLSYNDDIEESDLEVDEDTEEDNPDYWETYVEDDTVENDMDYYEEPVEDDTEKNM